MSKLGFWIVDYFVTHVALWIVLGAVAFGGIIVTTVLSRMKFPSVWSLLVGIVLFLIYLAFVGFVISVVGSISESFLERIGKRKE